MGEEGLPLSLFVRLVDIDLSPLRAEDDRGTSFLLAWNDGRDEAETADDDIGRDAKMADDMKEVGRCSTRSSDVDVSIVSSGQSSLSCAATGSVVR